MAGRRELYRHDHSGTRQWIFPGGERLFRESLPDQPSFRKALYESSLRLATLPPEYNCRLPFPGFLHDPVRILHGRTTDPESCASSTRRPRTSSAST